MSKQKCISVVNVYHYFVKYHSFNVKEAFVHEILIKVGDSDSGDKSTYQDGDIIHITKPSESKRVWDQMLERGRCTAKQYENAQISKGLFAWPWGMEEMQVHQVLVTFDDISDAQIELFLCGEQEIVTEGDIRTSYVKNKRMYNIHLDELSYLQGTTEVKFPKEIIAQMRNKQKTVEPQYDKPISISSIRRKI
jgi:hypothetical protein